MTDRFRLLRLSALAVDDEESMRHVPLYASLRDVLIRDGYSFRAPITAKAVDYNRVTFLNLTFWDPKSGGDVLAERRIPADVVAHVAWHHVVRRALGRSGSNVDGLLLGESIASAFDLYLVGRLLGRAPRSSFLQTQVPALAEVAQSAGLSERGFAKLLARMASDPERAFAELRGLLFDVATELVRAKDSDGAARALEGYAREAFYPLLHHYNISNWILFARAHAPSPSLRMQPDVARFDRELRRAAHALEWLSERVGVA